jgi:hypothetical protein
MLIHGFEKYLHFIQGSMLVCVLNLNANFRIVTIPLSLIKHCATNTLPYFVFHIILNKIYSSHIYLNTVYNGESKGDQ